MRFLITMGSIKRAHTCARMFVRHNESLYLRKHVCPYVPEIFRCKRNVCLCVCVASIYLFFCNRERRERTFATLRSARHAYSPAPLSQKAVTNCLGHGSAWRETRTDANGGRKNREREQKRQRERWDRIITPPAALEMVITEHPYYLPIFSCVSEVKWGCVEPGVKDNSPRADAWHRCHPSRRISSRSALALWVTCDKVTFFEQLSLSPFLSVICARVCACLLVFSVQLCLVFH